MTATVTGSAIMQKNQHVIGRFNRACRVITLVWLLVGVPVLFKLRPPRFNDFSQFYMGGAIARHGAWNALYPIPNPQSVYNPGLADDSAMQPTYAMLADENGIGDEPRFIQPPPDALLFEPLAFLSYPQARWVWIVVQCVSAAGIALLAGRFYELAAGKPSKMAGVVTLAAGCSYLLYSTVRAINQETLIAVLLALGIDQLVGMRRQIGLKSGISLALSALLKYAGVILLPLVLVMRRGMTLAWFVLLFAILIVATLVVSGGGTFVEYSRLFPLLARPYEWEGNQSLTGLLLRLIGHAPPLPAGATLGIRVAAGITFAGVIALLLLRSKKEWLRPEKVFAASALLITWMLLFSPLTWNKYFVYLIPLWGWLAWEAGQCAIRRTLVLIAIVLMWGPWEEMAVYQKFIATIHLREPLNSHMLIGLLLVAWIAVARLRKPVEPLAA